MSAEPVLRASMVTVDAGADTVADAAAAAVDCCWKGAERRETLPPALPRMVEGMEEEEEEEEEEGKGGVSVVTTPMIADGAIGLGGNAPALWQARKTERAASCHCVAGRLVLFCRKLRPAMCSNRGLEDWANDALLLLLLAAEAVLLAVVLSYHH